MRDILWNQEQENMLKDMDFYHLQEVYLTNIKKQLLETGIDALKNASKKVIHKESEATGEFIGNKIADKIIKPKHGIDENPTNAEEIIIPLEKREEVLNQLRQVLSKWNAT